MSKHSLKSKRRHPNAERVRAQAGHITFEFSPADKSFALIAGEAVHAADRRPLFTGYCTPEMGEELRKIANLFDIMMEKK